MELSDVVSRIEIDPRKLTEYALNPDNFVGADKAIIFQSVLGYNSHENPELFDVIELLIDLPAHSLCAGDRGAICEEYDNSHY